MKPCFAVLLFLIAALGSSARAATVVVSSVTTGTQDRWLYPFNGASPLGSEQRGALFMSPASNGAPGTIFNRRDGEVMLKFSLALPAAYASGQFRVTSASLTFWGGMTDTYVPGTLNSAGNPSRIEIFAAGFGPTYTEQAWAGSEAFIGSNAFAAAPRDPYPRDLATEGRAEDNVTSATAWGVAEPTGYTPGAMSDAYPIVCAFNTADTRIQGELRADLLAGSSSWIVTSTYDAAQPPAVSAYPRVLMSEAAGATAYGVSQQAPVLKLWLDAPSAAGQWSLYE